MARKRMLDPGLWRDPKVLQLTNDELIVFIGCISVGDDEGILEPNPHSLYFELARAELTPDKIEDALDRIAERGLIVRYGSYAFMPNWYKHQNLKGRKPQETKLRRPPRKALEQYPHYVEEWCATFVHKVDGNTVPREYPLGTCSSPATTSESSVTHECATSDSLVTPNRSEVKGSEGNIRVRGSDEPAPPAPAEKKPPTPKKTNAEPKIPEEDRELYDQLFHGLERRQPDGRYVNYGKEAKATITLIREARARSPDDHIGWVRMVIQAYLELREKDRWMGEKPCTPSFLVSAGILTQVLEHAQKRQQLQDTDWVDEVIDS